MVQTVQKTVWRSSYDLSDKFQQFALNKVLDMPVVVQRLVPGSDSPENLGISTVFARRHVQTVRRIVWSEGLGRF